MQDQIKPRRIVSQAPLKIGFCQAGCGAEIQYRTNPKVSCGSCRLERKLQSARAAMERQRRRRGIAPVKGTSIPCHRCGELFQRSGIAAKFCTPCGSVHRLDVARKRSREKAGTDAGREYARSWLREKRKSDPRFRISVHMRVLIHRAFGRRKAGRSWREFVPYSLPELMAHLERQFLSGMTWDNYGKWHVDHVVPLSSFSFEQPGDAEFQAAWALSNLRPLWAKDNIRKNARRTHLL